MAPRSCYEPDGVSRTGAVGHELATAQASACCSRAGRTREGRRRHLRGRPLVPGRTAHRIRIEWTQRHWARIHVMNADGTGLRRLDYDPGNIVDNDLVWSPDGTRIAFNRWRENQTRLFWDIMPIGVVPVDGGAVASLGPTPVPTARCSTSRPTATTILSLPGTLAGAPSTSTKASPSRRSTPTRARRGSSTGASARRPPGSDWRRRASARRVRPLAPEKEEPRVVGPGVQGEGVGCGERIRTSDLRVMSPTSCRCSTPRLANSRARGQFGQTAGASRTAGFGALRPLRCPRPTISPMTSVIVRTAEKTYIG